MIHSNTMAPESIDALTRSSIARRTNWAPDDAQCRVWDEWASRKRQEQRDALPDDCARQLAEIECLISVAFGDLEASPNDWRAREDWLLTARATASQLRSKDRRSRCVAQMQLSTMTDALWRLLSEQVRLQRERFERLRLKVAQENGARQTHAVRVNAPSAKTAQWLEMATNIRRRRPELKIAAIAAMLARQTNEHAVGIPEERRLIGKIRSALVRHRFK